MLKFRTPLLKFDEKVCLPGPKIITRQSFHERRRVARSGHTANGGAKVNTAVFQALTCFARVLIMLKNGFSDPNQTCSQVMLFWKWREGVGSLLFFFFFAVSNGDLCNFVCFPPGFTSAMSSPHPRHPSWLLMPTLVCLWSAVSVWPNLKQIGKMIVICGGYRSCLIPNHNLQKTFQDEKKKRQWRGRRGEGK